MMSHFLFSKPGGCAIHVDEPRSLPIDVDDGLGKGLGSFLRQVVPNAAGDDPVLVLAGKFLGVGAGVPVRRPAGA